MGRQIECGSDWERGKVILSVLTRGNLARNVYPARILKSLFGDFIAP
ncbi:MAG: hypothetical protein RLZZ74_1103 [Cyanobacteriota bacterium]|jgi:hypothetical protein